MIGYIVGNIGSQFIRIVPDCIGDDPSQDLFKLRHFFIIGGTRFCHNRILSGVLDDLKIVPARVCGRVGGTF